MITQDLFTLNVNALQISDDELFEFCRDNKKVRIERDEHKQIIIMSPTGFLSGNFNSELLRQLANWNIEHQAGLVSDSSTGFLLPDGSMRSPDAVWVSNALWKTVPNDQKNKFPHICPEFIIELRSSSDTLAYLQKKMTSTWIKNGTQLAWLIDPQHKQAFIYRADGSQEVVDSFQQKLLGESVLPDFELDLNLLKEI